MKKLLFLFILILAINLNAQDFRFYFNEAMKCYQEKDYDCTIENFKKSLEIFPQNNTTKYNLACAYALKGNSMESANLLNEIIPLGFGYDAETDPDFDKIRNTDEFKKVISKIQKAKVPINNSKVAFQINDKKLIPENLAYDKRTNKFFIGSLYKNKIIQSDQNGSFKDFISENQNGLWSVAGMKIDEKNNSLWVCSGTGTQMINYNDSVAGRSGLFQFDLVKGNLINKFFVNDINQHFLNDLVITNDGNIYVTDSNFPAVYFLDKKEGKLKVFADLNGLIFPNGITISDDQKYLFVAHFAGIKIIEIETKNIFDLSHPDKIHTGLIDGLYFYKNNLLAIQNSRVIKFILTDDKMKVTDQIIIEANNPDFNIPTTGVIVDNEFYYIANSQLRSYTSPGKIFSDDKLKDVVILKIDLDKN